MTVGAMDELLMGVHSAIGGDSAELLRSFERQQRKEREADALRRQIIEELARGELPPDERIGFMRLARQIDLVTDWSHESHRMLVLLPFDKAPRDIQDATLKMCKRVQECIASVQKCLNKLAAKELQESLAYADEVERYEEETDALYQDAREIFIKCDFAEIGVGAAILLSQFLDAIENIADRCEDVGDQTRVIAVSISTP